MFSSEMQLIFLKIITFFIISNEDLIKTSFFKNLIIFSTLFYGLEDVKLINHTLQLSISERLLLTAFHSYLWAET